MGKRKERAQALIEFVLLLPIIFIVILGIVDFGRIFSAKTKLESLLNDTVREMQNQEKTLAEFTNSWDEKEITLTLTPIENQTHIQITMKEELTLLTPGISLFLKNPYPVVAERVIFYEKEME